MHQREDQPGTQSGLFIFLGISLIWIFMILWAIFGMVPVVIVACVLNHLITRLGIVLDTRETGKKQA